MMLIYGEQVSAEEFDRRLYSLYHSHEEKQHKIKIPINWAKRQQQQKICVTVDDDVKDREKTFPLAFDSSKVVIQKQPLQEGDDEFEKELKYEQKLEATKKRIGRLYQLAREAKEKKQIRIILDVNKLPPLPSDSTINIGKNNKRKRSHGETNIPTRRNNNRLLRV